jgi:hypothetical protein
MRLMLRRRKNIINIAVKSKKLNLKMNLVMAVVVVMAALVLAELVGMQRAEMQVTRLRVTAEQLVLLDQRMAEMVEMQRMVEMAETAATR